jgi:hypothetical protein
MKLNFEYSTPYVMHWSNESFHYIFDKIRKDIQKHYPEITEVNVVPLPSEGHPPAGTVNGVSSLKIINSDNGKTTVLTFWDKGLDIITPKSDWEKYNVVHLIGGLGVNTHQAEFLCKIKNAKYTPFQYPLPFHKNYDLIDSLRNKYNYRYKVKKACFIGSLYHGRQGFVDLLSKHPMFEIIGSDKGFVFESYYNEMRKYAMTLSLNGNGEFCIRDFESMGMGIPIFRSELSSTLHSPLISEVNYLPASKVTDILSLEDLAEKFIHSIEKYMSNEELLNKISENNLIYYENYVRLDKIVKLFFEVFDLNLIK